MKHITQLENFEHSNWDAKSLRKALLSAVYAETYTKLIIFQRAQRINATRFLPPKTKAVKCHQSSLYQNSRRSSIKVSKQSIEHAEPMLDERVLDEIRLDQELSLLLKIYAEASNELNSTEDVEDVLEAKGARRPHSRLYEIIEAQKADKNEVEQALSELRNNQNKLNELKAQVTEQRERGEQQLKERDENISTLRHNLHNVHLLNQLELRLVQRWEENRFTQAAIIGSNEERNLQQKIDGLRQRIANEEIIIVQLDNFSKKQFAELNASIVEWQQKYANEMAKRCAETHEKEHQMLQLQKSLERHRETYAKRKQFVRDYLVEKEIERQLYEQQVYRVNCAVRIQAWWRGVMVRRGLGPFKKKTKKGRKGKGKAK